MNIANDIMDSYSAIVYTHKTVGVDKLASHYLGWNEIKELSKYYDGEMAVLQTCNRIEIYLFSRDRSSVSEILHYLNEVHNKVISTDATILRGRDAVKHLFEVASGIDSLSVGEYEILKQIKDAMRDSMKLGIGSRYMRALLERSLKVGRRVRLETAISRGKVGVYSLAVEFAKSRFGDIVNKRIAILGAGEIGGKLALILHNEGATDVTIFNRTFERGRNLAIKYGYSYFPLDFSRLHNYDIIFSAIFYPDKVKAPEGTVVIDLGSPPVFEGPNVYTLKDLEELSRAKLEERQKEVEKAQSIIEEGLEDFRKDCLKLVYDDFVSSFMSRVEETRKEEVERALRVLGDNSQETRDVLDAMTRSMIKKIFSPMFQNMRRAVENNEINYINLATSLFTHGGISQDKTEKVKAEQEYKGRSSGDEAES
ncbi:Glutamyl-tRNA reductase [Metallosphaera sp. J1]|uniref:glutamyl-tRNA reductase n=1 Tax=Metallosphaera javensis (ex Hofmann et al. 2022) TaxID=99938 RepID=UPI001EDDE22A|nr:glutamyl-tRNA reductase [Metallosphaera javensis (ex Hofmann et al. 2022)]MCG3109406.1 Glutamyl-tRNA reductase [Metallosphaera javensis (ex Hofmann et al. 2022)]